MPPWCHASPYSPPPRMLGTATTPALLQPQQQRAGERRRHADVEPAVPGQIGRVVSVWLRPGPVHEEHGDRGAVPRGVAHLLHLDTRPDRGRPPPAARACARRPSDRAGTRSAAPCRTRSRRTAPPRPIRRPSRTGCRAWAASSGLRLLPLEIGQTEARGGALQIAQRQRVRPAPCAPSSTASLLAGAPTLRQRSRSRPLRIATIEPVVRRVEVGAEVESPADDLAVEGGRQILRDRRRRRPPARQVLQVEIGLVEGAGDADHQPASVGREADAGPVLLLRRLEDQRVFGGIAAQPMKEDGAVIVLLALGHRARPRDSGCSRTRCRRAARPGQPRGCRRSGPRRIARCPPRGRAARSARCRSRTARRPGGVPSSLGKNQSSAVVPSASSALGSSRTRSAPIDAVAHVEDRLVLRPFPPLIEVAAPSRRRRAQRADREQLLEPARMRGRAGTRSRYVAVKRVLLARSRTGSRHSRRPPASDTDRESLAMERVDHAVRRRRWRGGHGLQREK